MFISELFKNKKVVFSFEIFPPKSTSSINTIYNTLNELNNLNPDYISVTYGAGGSVANNKTLELSAYIKNTLNIEPLAHLTCINSKKEEIDNLLLELRKNNVENILALRGDVPDDNLKIGEYNYAYELVEHINNKNKFCIGAACYPEGHIQSQNLEEDIDNLKFKVDCGVDFLVSQLFFDNNLFYNFLDKSIKKGIKIPIQAGIMPVTNKKQIQRIVSLCGAKLPDKFIKIMDRYENHPEALRDAGIAYALEQIVDLVSSGVSGIHLYTMNNPYVAKKITEGVKTILNSLNDVKEAV